MINLYTLPSCPVCQMVKTKLAQKNIPYNEFNLEDYTNDLHTDRAPVLKVDTNLILKTPSEINTWINSQCR